MRKWMVMLCCVAGIEAGQGQLWINEIMPANASFKYDPDYFNFSAWIELYNSGSTAINLGGFYLTDDKQQPKRWMIPAGTVIPPKGFLLFWTDGMNQGFHPSFKLAADGEFAGISNPSGQFIDSLSYPPQYFNTSYGRSPDGGNTWYFFSQPTPGSSNMATGYNKISGNPVFSLPGGFYASPLTLTLSCSSQAASIYYTLDGSEPDASATKYTTPLSITTTTVVRARVYDTNALPGKIITHTYFIGSKKTLPVVSIAIEPRFLWDDSIGIYVTGVNGIPGPYNEPASNFYRDWERAANLELFWTDGKQVSTDGIGLQIEGNYTRILSQKSLDIHYNAKYGSKKLKYPLFNSKPSITEFYSFYLRNSGNDWKYTTDKWRGTLFKDGLVQTLIIGQMDVDYQAYQPAVLYINGQYFGIQNLREKMNSNYIKGNYPEVNSDNVDIIKQIQVDPWCVIAGDTSRYYRFLLYLSNHNLADAGVYNYVKTQMDIREFINYQIVETYACNTDWPHNNQRVWSPRDGTGKWRWMLNDFDAGMGSTVQTVPSYNMIEASFNSSAWWGSCVIDHLFLNASFRDEYAQTYAAHLNTTFEPSRVNRIIDSLKKNLDPEMPNQIARWSSEPMAIPSLLQWNTDVTITKNFASQRPSYTWQHLKNKVNKYDMASLSLSIEPAGAGTVFIQGAKVNGSSLTGPFFNKLPIEFEAKASNGYVFLRWEITNNGLTYQRTNSLMKDTLEGDYVIVARFGSTNQLQVPAEDLFAIYPVPAKNYLIVEHPSYKGPLSYALFTPGGQKMIQHNLFFDGSVTIPLEGFLPGVYILKIDSNLHLHKTVKIIIE